MKRTALIVLLAGALLTPFFLGSGFAQGWGGMHGGMAGNGHGITGYNHGMMGNGYGMMNGMWNNQNIPEKYQLATEQQQKIEEISSAYFENIEPLQNQLVALQQDYTNAVNSGQSQDVLNSQQEAIQELQTRIRDAHVEAQKQINNVLTEDQVAYYGGGHHFLMNAAGGMMADGTGYYGCYGANAYSQGNQSQTGPRGMMNQ